MFKWLCLILSMGCVANATNLSKKVNKDDDNKDTDFPEIRTIKNEIRWSKKRTAILATRWNYIYISIFNIIMKFNSKNSINKRKVVNND